jgi:plasminogen activator inhibitor 1 RNA-binding protein
VTQGWGGQSGEKEWDDERAAEKIAQNDENEPQTPAGEEAQEPADKSKSYTDYLAEKAAQGDLSAKPVRSANEGSKVDSKWAQAKELKRDSEDEEYIKAKEDKSKREKARKEKNYVDVDLRFVEPARGASGPRGRGRGGRGGDRGGRGARGGRGNGPRPERSSGAAPVTVDEKNFPSLGGK